MLVNWDKKGGIKAIPLNLVGLIICIAFTSQSVSVNVLVLVFPPFRQRKGKPCVLARAITKIIPYLIGLEYMGIILI